MCGLRQLEYSTFGSVSTVDVWFVMISLQPELGPRTLKRIKGNDLADFFVTTLSINLFKPHSAVG